MSEQVLSAKKDLELEEYFQRYRENVIGYQQSFQSPYGGKEIIYADWTASGRMYGPIEETLIHEFGPFVGNTHTEATITGTLMTRAYHTAHETIKKHVNAQPDDVIITTGSGMTGAVCKLQRILGLKVPEQLNKLLDIPTQQRPVVFVTHMEHHSNHTSWLETVATVECILPDEHGLIDLDNLRQLLAKYKDRETKIASVTACSNVTGIQTRYHDVAKVMHEHNGLCFVDFACSAPYVAMDMHPPDPLQRLDAIYFSPHKFLGGPGTPGVLIFNSSLYRIQVPDQPGGGTVTWTNPWGEHHYFDSIEAREDGGTPGFLQAMKAALCVKLKEEMGIQNLLNREEEILETVFEDLTQIDRLHILAGNIRQRLAVVSFYIEGLHYNLGVKLLNDRYGIQVRGGCSCAGTYGHYLLNISQNVSHEITRKIDEGDFSVKPGWIRLSIHPIMTTAEVKQITNALRELAMHFESWREDYHYDARTNEFTHKNNTVKQEEKTVQSWFNGVTK